MQRVWHSLPFLQTCACCLVSSGSPPLVMRAGRLLGLCPGHCHVRHCHKPLKPKVLTKHVLLLLPLRAAPAAACTACVGVCCPQVVVPRLSTNGLRWHCSGDFVARQCLQYRGVLPVCADPSLGSPDGAILRAALAEVSAEGCMGCGVLPVCVLQGRCLCAFVASVLYAHACCNSTAAVIPTRMINACQMTSLSCRVVAHQTRLPVFLTLHASFCPFILLTGPQPWPVGPR